MLDYGDDGPPDFHNKAMLKEVNSVLPPQLSCGDSVSALWELFLLQKEVDTTLSDERSHSSAYLTTEERNQKRKTFETNLKLSKMLDKKIKSKMVDTLSIQKTS